MPHALLDRYKFFLIHAKNERRIYPEQKDAPIQYVKADEQVFFRLRIKNDLTLTKADYAWLLDIELSTDRCLPITVVVKRIRPGNTDLTIYTGIAYLNNATINRSFCEIILKVEAEDNYTKLYAAWEKTVNVLNGATKVCVNTNFANLPAPISVFETVDLEVEIDFVSSGDVNTSPTLPPLAGPSGEGWVLYTDEVSGVVRNPNLTGTRNTRWIRERASVNPGGNAPGGWVQDGAFYNRYIQSFRDYSRDYSNVLYFTTPAGFGFPEYNFTVEEYRHYYSYLPFENPALCNGIDISEALDKLLEGTGISYRSNFFNINPLGPSPDNAQYNSAQYNRVIIFKRTDIKNPDATNPATVFEMTLKGLQEQLYKTFQVRIFLDGTTLRLEHQSYFENRQGLNLVILYPVAIEGLHVYTYENQNRPAREEWYQDGEDQSQYAFGRWTLDYVIDDNCFNPTGNTLPTNSIIADKVMADVQSLVANPGNFQDAGMVFVNTWEYEGEVMIDALAYTDGRLGVLNYRMTPQYLGELLWLHKRPYDSAAVITPVVQGFFDPPPPAPIIFALSLQRFKKQVPIVIKFPAIEGFDELLEIKSQIGWGEVTEAEYSLATGELSFTLLHE